MKRNVIWGILILGVTLSGCAAIGQYYQPTVQERQIQDDVFMVNCTGTGYTSLIKAQEIALCRSAEICLRNGFKYFAVIDKSTDIQTYVGSSHDFVFGGQQIHSSSNPVVNLTIKCYKEKPVEVKDFFDAEQILKYQPGGDSTKPPYGNFKPGSEPDGFGGIKWETDISTFSGMEYVENLSTDKFSAYIKKDNDFKTGRPEIEEITYFFVDDKLSCVIVDIATERWTGWKEGFFKTLGPGNKIKGHESIERYKWVGWITMIDLIYDKQSKKAILSASSTKAWLKEQKKK